MSNFKKPNIVLSACIEHKHVRYDGSMISSEFVKRLEPFVNYILVCPETEIGLPSPREALRLVRENHDDEIKLISSIHGKDHTKAMVEFTNSFIESLDAREIDGFLLKAKSPTCGYNGVKVYRGVGKANVYSQKVPGFFGGAVVERFPDYPVSTERHISNFVIRDHFFTSIFTLAQFRHLKTHHKIGHLRDFHAENKYLLMTFFQDGVKRLGQIVANHDKLPSKTVYEFYEKALRDLLQHEPTKEKRVNVYTHMYGYFKDKIKTSEKDHFFETLNDYQNDKLPYTNVLTLLLGYAVRFDEDYLLDQTIFSPYPKDLLQVADSGKQL
ncbi:MAG: DUF523 and DUF1722 domain-containing protein [Candidatus Izemoplasma sp.]|nr:DUF523 and DUF1722 domain-containing protein [Candidatus Izemoplasma sp.]